MGAEGIHTKVRWEVAEAFTQPLANCSQQSWLTGEVPGEWNSTNVVPIHKLDLGTGEAWEQILFRAITQNVQDRWGPGPAHTAS